MTGTKKNITADSISDSYSKFIEEVTTYLSVSPLLSAEESFDRSVVEAVNRDASRQQQQQEEMPRSRL
jgi:antitoxin component HigA of HigAB toxin-antitoxin module